MKSSWVQDPVGTVLSTELPTDYHLDDSIAFAGVCGGSGKDFPVGSNKYIKMGSCVFQCDVPHQWIAQPQVGPVSVYCDWVGCHVLSLPHGISVWQHIGQDTTATSKHRRDMTSNV